MKNAIVLINIISQTEGLFLFTLCFVKDYKSVRLYENAQNAFNFYETQNMRLSVEILFKTRSKL